MYSIPYSYHITCFELNNTIKIKLLHTVVVPSTKLPTGAHTCHIDMIPLHLHRSFYQASRNILPLRTVFQHQATRSLCAHLNDKSNPLLSHLSGPDVLRLLTRLSPLAHHAHTRYNHLIESQADSNLSSKHANELRRVTSIATTLSQLTHIRDELIDASSLLTDPSSDDELRSLARDEQTTLNARIETTTFQLLSDLLDDAALDTDKPAPVSSRSSTILEVRAGTGGTEAGLFASELIAMYTALSEYRRWSVRILSHTTSDAGGTREAIVRISGASAFHTLCTEAGVHRVQRVPATETQGRIHTSTATIAVLPDDMRAGTTPLVLRTEDVRFDVYRASGAGGQHVNTTESAARATHVPTGLVATCQDERSQHRNRAGALETLTAKVSARRVADAAAARTGERRAQLGAIAGERGDRIRTYNFPHQRVTDHRVVPHPLVFAVAPSARLAVGDKNAPLQSVMQGGAHLLNLIDNVNKARSLVTLADLLRRADSQRSTESDDFAQLFVAESMV